MTQVQSNPNAPKKDPRQLETVWIDWLNESQSEKSGSSPEALELTSKRSEITLMSSDEIETLRFTNYVQILGNERKRFGIIESLVPPATKDGFGKLYQEAMGAITQDLSVPLENDKALSAIENVVRFVNSACSKDLAPGTGSILKEICLTESLHDFKAAEILSPGTCTTSLTEIKNLVAKKPPNIGEAKQKLLQLNTTIQDLVRNHKSTKEAIEQTKVKIADTQKYVNGKDLTIQAKADCIGLLEKATVLVQDAERTEVVEPKGKTPKALADSVTAHSTTVQNLLKLAEDKCAEIRKMTDDLISITDNQKKTQFVALKKAQTTIANLYESAVVAGMPRNDKAKNDCLSYEAASFTPANLTDTEKLAKEIVDSFKAVQEEWEKTLRESGKLIRFGMQLQAATSLSEAEDENGVDTRSDSAKKILENAQWCLEQYDSALTKAKARLYGEATVLLKKALDGDTSNTGLRSLQESSAEALSKASVTESDIKERSEAFNTILGDITDKNQIRFDKKAMALMMGVGLSTDDDGELVYSDQFKLMQVQLEKGLVLWHGLCDQGVDPFKAAVKAFAGIPENFWPPSAVRAIALFRKAEGEFAAERQVAELEAELSGKSYETADSVIETALETIGKDGAERGKDVVDGMLAVFKTELIKELGAGAVEKLSNKEIEKLAADKYKVDIGTAGEALGGLAAGFAVVAGAYKTGKNVKELAEKQQEIAGFDPLTDSPVKLRMNEFERNRAIWHLVNDAADAILSALGPATTAVPALGLLGDIKTVALDIADAAVYFNRLKEVKAMKNVAKMDPETIAELALANEADKLGLLGAEKTFSAAMAIAKIIGQGLDMGGVTAAAGFAVKAGATILTYLGKAIFTLRKWNDRRKATNILLAARANPTDILYVEPVFEKCTMYSRFLLADGALNGDSWCRRYIITRGVSDTDLDNPNTSCSILREYLNVTFENLSGEAQEDDDLGTTKREQKEKAKLPSDELDYNSTWQPKNANASSNAFSSSYNEAVVSGLAANPGGLKSMTGALQAYTESRDTADRKIKEFKDAFDTFENALKTKKDVDQATQTAKRLLKEAIDLAVNATGCFNTCVSAIQGFVPLSTAKDSKKKPKIHFAFQEYLRELRESLALDHEINTKFRNESSRYTVALQVKKGLKEDLTEDAQEWMSSLSKESAEETKRIAALIEKGINTRWSSMTWTSKLKGVGDGTQEKLIKLASQQLGLSETVIRDRVNETFDRTKAMTIQKSRAYAVDIGKKHVEMMESAMKITDNGKRKQAELNAEAHTNDQIQKVGIEPQLKMAEKLLTGEFDQIVGELFEKNCTVDQKYKHSSPVELTQKYWQKEKKALVAKKWKFVKTGVGPAADEYETAKMKWELVPLDEFLQGDYRSSHGKLFKCINSIPLFREDGVELPGVKELKRDLLIELASDLREFEKIVNTPSDDDPKKDPKLGWVVPDSQLKKWPMTKDGWLLMIDLAEKHAWVPNKSKRSSIGNCFERFDEYFNGFTSLDPSTPPLEKTKAKDKARKYAEELKKEIDKWDPNSKMKGGTHHGMLAYKRVMSEVLAGYLAKELKA